MNHQLSIGQNLRSQQKGERELLALKYELWKYVYIIDTHTHTYIYIYIYIYNRMRRYCHSLFRWYTCQNRVKLSAVNNDQSLSDTHHVNNIMSPLALLFNTYLMLVCFPTGNVAIQCHLEASVHIDHKTLHNIDIYHVFACSKYINLINRVCIYEYMERDFVESKWNTKHVHNLLNQYGTDNYHVKATIRPRYFKFESKRVSKWFNKPMIYVTYPTYLATHAGLINATCIHRRTCAWVLTCACLLKHTRR